MTRTKMAIAVGTMYGREAWLADCLASLKGCDIEVVPISSPHFELSVIAEAARKFDEFIFIPDSTEVRDHRNLVAQCFGTADSVSLSQFPEQYGMYLGKYVSQLVLQVGVPFVADKLDAVHYETAWTRKYAQFSPTVELGNLPHSDIFVEKHGRRNMVCENRWLRRYKASWDGPTMVAEHRRIQALRERAN